MARCEDQPYDIVRLVGMMIDAACSHQPQEQLDEVVSWFVAMHPFQDHPIAGPALRTLASQILYVVDSFRTRLSDRRFPYNRIPTPLHLAAMDFYVMRRFEVGLEAHIQP